MVRLATVASSFHARVIAARLGVEGMTIELRGNVDGIYPIGDVHVFVDADDLPSAQELLLVDEVESAFDMIDDSDDASTPRELWVILGAVVMLAAVLFVRTF
ncbi:MAG: hypothetical protein QOG82_2448 [Actinomycetota bacterium]|jgi:hypothetical protein|nr:hypothetical protein [Actinomycetota bacterium]